MSKGGEVVGIAGEEGNSEIAMGRVGEYACNAGALQLGKKSDDGLVRIEGSVLWLGRHR